MKQIQLTQNQVTFVDDDLYEWLNQWKWYYRKRWNRPGGDVVRTLHGKTKEGINFSQTLYMAPLINPVPKGYVVDHIDRNPLNNQRYNLRQATYSLNTLNSGVRINNKTQEKNIHWAHDRQRYVLQLHQSKKKRLWKVFKTLQDAVEFRDSIV